MSQIKKLGKKKVLNKFTSILLIYTILLPTTAWLHGLFDNVKYIDVLIVLIPYLILSLPYFFLMHFKKRYSKTKKVIFALVIIGATFFLIEKFTKPVYMNPLFYGHPYSLPPTICIPDSGNPVC